MAVALDFLVLGGAGFLREAGQGVVFAEEGDDRAAFAGLADHRGRDARDVFGDPEALVLQLGDMLGDRALLGVANFRNRPDPVAEFDEALLAGVNMAPEIVAVVHCCVSSCGELSALSRKRGASRPATAGHGGPAGDYPWCLIFGAASA